MTTNETLRVQQLTTVELLTAAYERADAFLHGPGSQPRSVSGPAAREFALAKTAIEDAQMRFSRGMAIVNGDPPLVDVEPAR